MYPVRAKLQRCSCCDQVIDDKFRLHKLSLKHQINFYLWAYNNKRKSMVRDRDGIVLKITPKTDENGLSIIPNVKHGKYSIQIDPQTLDKLHKTLEFRCSIYNDRKADDMYITTAHVLDASSFASMKDDLLNQGFIKLKPKATYDGIVIRFQLHTLIVGSFKIPLAFNLQTEDGSAEITMCRAIVVSIVDWKEDNLDKAKSPFTDKPWEQVVRIVQSRVRMPILKKYPIPSQYYKYFLHGFKDWPGISQGEFGVLASLRREMEPGHVTPENYRKFLHNCLWLEEVVSALMLGRYNMEAVNVEVREKEIYLEVPGLAEKRPSLIKGDIVRLRVHEAPQGFEGCIKTVEDKGIIIENVDLALLNDINFHPEEKVDVAFQLGRLPLERSHQGIDNVCSTGTPQALFPDRIKFGPYTEKYKLNEYDFINKDVIKNHEQRTAVEKILNCSSQAAPYIVFGPPGTGKTVTIVEAIMQIIEETDKKILVCAPANAACDMLALKLKQAKCDVNEMRRIHSESRDVSTIPNDIREYSNINKEGDIESVDSKELNKYRVVITTLILIGKFKQGYQPDCLFIDEAAQALESDACVAIGIIKKGGQIVLAGDPKQLGPIVQSKVAQEYGLNISLLERLMDQKPYAGENNPNFLTMLKQNFRSHPLILELPNNLFYGNNLISYWNESDPLSNVNVFGCIPQFNTTTKDRKKSISSGSAIEFCSVSAKEKREGRSPSYFNPAEANMVLKYVKTLMSLNLQRKVEQSDIGIITPYVRQVYKIKALLNGNNFNEVEVGSVETFQGREKRIIIISTVRAQHNLLKYDKEYELGFVRQDKRFNVALTRAASKLIVIGCPMVLATDEKWHMYITRCQVLNSYHGAEFESRTDEKMREIIDRFSKISAFSQK